MIINTTTIDRIQFTIFNSKGIHVHITHHGETTTISINDVKANDDDQLYQLEYKLIEKLNRIRTSENIYITSKDLNKFIVNGLSQPIDSL